MVNKQNNKSLSLEFHYFILRTSAVREKSIKKVILAAKDLRPYVKNIYTAGKEYPNMIAGYMLAEIKYCDELKQAFTIMQLPVKILADTPEDYLEQSEVDSLLHASSRLNLNNLQIGSSVLIKEGPFAGVRGVVTTVAEEMCSIKVQMLGRFVSVNLKINQVEQDG